MGPVALTTDLSQQDFFDVFETAIRSVPYAQGINNHMGSALTQEPVAMTWLMQAIKKHQLFFVDSRTTPKSVASKIAIQQSVRTASRDVFLDNDRTSYAIDRQFRYLLLLAKRNKSAIAIGHPYAETLEYLERAIPILSAENISIVPVSKIISTRLARRQLAANFTASE